jgi:hypothetical protein
MMSSVESTVVVFHVEGDRRPDARCGGDHWQDVGHRQVVAPGESLPEGR